MPGSKTNWKINKQAVLYRLNKCISMATEKNVQVMYGTE